MKIKNASAGKIGAYIIGPKQHLNEQIRLGEISICIAKEIKNHTPQPYIWLIGGVEQLIDYISLARANGELDSASADNILSKIDDAKTKIPNNAYARLASVLNIESESDLKELIELAQVSVTCKIAGVCNYSGPTPKWVAKTANYASIH